MRALSIFCAVSLLTACSSAPVAPDVLAHVETVSVPKPTPVLCVHETDIPPPPVKRAIAPDADIEQYAAWAKLRDKDLRIYAGKLNAALIACSHGGTP